MSHLVKWILLWVSVIEN